MTVKLIENWKSALKLRSVQLSLVGAAVSGVEIGVKMWMTGETPWMAVAMFGITMAAAVARIIVQPELHLTDV